MKFSLWISLDFLYDFKYHEREPPPPKKKKKKKLAKLKTNILKLICMCVVCEDYILLQKNADVSKKTGATIFQELLFIIFIMFLSYLFGCFIFWKNFYPRLVHPTTVWYDQWVPAKAFEVCPQNEYFFKSKCSLNCITLYL